MNNLEKYVEEHLNNDNGGELSYLAFTAYDALRKLPNDKQVLLDRLLIARAIRVNDKDDSRFFIQRNDNKGGVLVEMDPNKYAVVHGIGGTEDKNTAYLVINVRDNALQKEILFFEDIEEAIEELFKEDL